MRRREFIVFAGAIAVCPRVVVARGTSKHLGVLMGYREDDEAARARVDAFFKTLEQSGWRQGQNLEVEYYGAAGKPEQIKSAAVELVRRNPDACAGSRRSARMFGSSWGGGAEVMTRGFGPRARGSGGPRPCG
jgi:hypothetical protein